MENQKFNFGKSKVSQSQKTKMVQNVFNKVTKKLDDVVDGQEKLEDLLTSSPVKGEA